MVLFEAMVDHNIAAMAEEAGGAARLMPHVKTHKSQAVAGKQLESGVSGFKCATLRELQMVLEAGAAGGDPVVPPGAALQGRAPRRPDGRPSGRPRPRHSQQRLPRRCPRLGGAGEIPDPARNARPRRRPAPDRGGLRGAGDGPLPAPGSRGPPRGERPPHLRRARALQRPHPAGSRGQPPHRGGEKAHRRPRGRGDGGGPHRRRQHLLLSVLRPRRRDARLPGGLHLLGRRVPVRDAGHSLPVRRPRAEPGRRPPPRSEDLHDRSRVQGDRRRSAAG